MGKRRNLNKVPIPTNVRVRMHRQIKQVKSQRESVLIEQIEENCVVNDVDSSTLKAELCGWANTVDSLLSILISHGIKEVPKNHRTLMKTPVNLQISDVAGGQFWYNGLGKCLQSIFSSLNRDILISLNFNIDGIPLYNSSEISFWPILGSISGKMIIFTSLMTEILQRYMS